MRERRRQLRAARDGGAWQDWMLSGRLTDYGDEDWFSDQEEEEEEEEGECEREVSTADINSAVLRESRLRVMRELPKCADKEMAERYRIIKEVRSETLRQLTAVKVPPGKKCRTVGGGDKDRMEHLEEETYLGQN